MAMMFRQRHFRISRANFLGDMPRRLRYDLDGPLDG